MCIFQCRAAEITPRISDRQQLTSHWGEPGPGAYEPCFSSCVGQHHSLYSVWDRTGEAQEKKRLHRPGGSEPSRPVPLPALPCPSRHTFAPSLRSALPHSPPALPECPAPACPPEQGCPGPAQPALRAWLREGAGAARAGAGWGLGGPRFPAGRMWDGGGAPGSAAQSTELGWLPEGTCWMAAPSLPRRDISLPLLLPPRRWPSRARPLHRARPRARRASALSSLCCCFAGSTKLNTS